MARRRKRSRGLGYNRGGLPFTPSRDYVLAVTVRKANARRNCPAFQARVSDAVRNYLPGHRRFEPAFFHRLKLAEDSAARGHCKHAYREIGEAKKFGKRHQRRDDE